MVAWSRNVVIRELYYHRLVLSLGFGLHLLVVVFEVFAYYANLIAETLCFRYVDSTRLS